MIKKLFLIALTCISCIYTSAQTDTSIIIPKPELRKSISIGYGIGTAPQIISSYATAYGLLFSFGTVLIEERNFSGAFSFNMKLFSAGKFRFGGELVYEKTIQTVRIIFDNKTEKENVSYFSIMPRADYYWIEKDNFKLYSGLGLGGLFVQTTNRDNGKKYNYFYPAFQLSALGIEVGKTVCFFAEAGIGVSGSIQAGLRAKFQ